MFVRLLEGPWRPSLCMLNLIPQVSLHGGSQQRVPRRKFVAVTWPLSLRAGQGVINLPTILIGICARKTKETIRCQPIQDI